MAAENALKAFLTGIIDYAGLFPPAELSLTETLSNYTMDRDSAYSWMLAKLVLPENLLSDLATLAGNTKIKTPLQLSVLSNNPTKLLSNEPVTTQYYNIASIEYRLPTDSPDQDLIASACEASSRHNLAIFFEVPSGPNFLQNVELCLQQIKAQNNSRVGFKLRCGTTDPGATPTPATLAEVIGQCSQSKLPIKFTAGLHHPFRKFQPGFGDYMHGFFNVFFAAMLAYDQQASTETLIKVLSCESADVILGVNQLEWQGYLLKLPTIESLRSKYVLSFGSCSFLEPINDLKELGWNAELFS